jgi:heterodisulfide reductase subunit A
MKPIPRSNQLKTSGTGETRPRIGVYVCQCGTNIASMVDVEEVSGYAAQLEDVVVSRTYAYMC